MGYTPLEVADRFVGVNRREDQQSIRRVELFNAQNFFPATRGIARTRLGATRFNSTGWAGAQAGRAIVRFYPIGGTRRKIMALNVTGNDVIVYGDDGLSTLIEMTGGVALTANRQWTFAQFIGNLYMGNALQAIQVTSNGTTKTSIGGSPAMPIVFPAPPFRFRLLGFGEAANPKRLYYTNTYSVDTPASNYLTIEHPEDISAVMPYGQDEDRGVFGQLAIFTPTSTWIQRGEFGDLSTLDRATDRLGCNSPQSLQNTPYGLIGLGYDGSTDLVVFMIPVGGGRPIVISEPIRGIEVLPLQYRVLACGFYFGGIYRLSFVPSGGTTPTRQWWADLRHFNMALPNYGIGWWGPMTGQTIGAFAVQDQGTDTNQIIAADGAAGFINNIDVADTYTDYGTAYTAILETKFLDGGDPIYLKSFDGVIIGARPTATENIAVELDVDEGVAVASETITATVTAPVVDETTLVGPDTLVGGARYEEYVQHLGAHCLATGPVSQ